MCFSGFEGGNTLWCRVLQRTFNQDGDEDEFWVFYFSDTPKYVFLFFTKKQTFNVIRKSIKQVSSCSLLSGSSKHLQQCKLLRAEEFYTALTLETPSTHITTVTIETITYLNMSVIINLLLDDNSALDSAVVEHVIASHCFNKQADINILNRGMYII